MLARDAYLRGMRQRRERELAALPRSGRDATTRHLGDCNP